MADVVVASAEPNAGVTTIAAGVARVAGVEAAAFEGSLSSAVAANPGARVVLVATATAAVGEVAGQLRATPTAAGVILNRVPERKVAALRAEYETAGAKVLAVVPEDLMLAAPTVGQFADALGASGEFIEENRDRALARPLIASIAADPGQNYYATLDAQTVIVRSDKPDLQLSALNAGARCLAVTGELPVLSYVLDRVREDEIPLIRSPKDTKETMAVLEELFGTAPFAGTEKAERIAALLVGLDVDALRARATNPA